MTIPLPVLPGVFRVSLNWSLQNGQTATNVIHIKGNTGNINAATLFPVLAAAATPAMWTTVSNIATVSSVDILELDGVSSTVPFGAPTPTASWTGTGTGDPTPQVAGIITLQTGLRGRNRRGRVFLPFAAEGEMADGVWAASLITPVSNAWSAFNASMGNATPNSYSLAVAAYDRKNNGAGAQANLVQSLILRPVTGTQRRRVARLR